MNKEYFYKKINAIFSLFGFKIVRNISDDLSMESMIKRLSLLNININTIVDIGASDGKWSVSCMDYFPRAQYLAIEPLEERKEPLEVCKSRFKNFNYALCVAGDIDGGEVGLKVTEDLDGSTIDGINQGVLRLCRMRSVDSLISELSLPGPYLIKFDTHGYEIPILSGCKKILLNTNAIIMETYNFDISPKSIMFYEMCIHMNKLGFRSANLANPMLRLYDKMFWQCDILFLRNDHESFFYRNYR